MPEYTYTPDDLIYDQNYPVIIQSGTVALGEVLVRGSLVGLTTNKELKLSDVSTTDGSQSIYGVIVNEKIDATVSKQPCSIYLSGYFSKGHLVVGNGHDLNDEDLLMNLRKKNIYIGESVS